jgi:hypothetical protein
MAHEESWVRYDFVARRAMRPAISVRGTRLGPAKDRTYYGSETKKTKFQSIGYPCANQRTSDSKRNGADGLPV